MKKSIILILAGLAAGCGAEEPGVLPRPEEPARVTVSDASMTASVRTFPATVVAANQARLATRMSGTILKIPVDVGSRVRAGDTLVVLDAEDIRARVAAAEAGVELARKSFERIQNLARDGAASQAELDRARAALLGAEAALGDARAQGRYAFLTAPFAGTVTVRSADPGDLAAPGVPILTVTGAGGLEVGADPARPPAGARYPGPGPGHASRSGPGSRKPPLQGGGPLRGGYGARGSGPRHLRSVGRPGGGGVGALDSHGCAGSARAAQGCVRGGGRRTKTSLGAPGRDSGRRGGASGRPLRSAPHRPQSGSDPVRRPARG